MFSLYRCIVKERHKDLLRFDEVGNKDYCIHGYGLLWGCQFHQSFLEQWSYYSWFYTIDLVCRSINIGISNPLDNLKSEIP
jgi:hypothetical protein